MTLYRFQIQNCINVEVDAASQEDARMKVIENLSDYADDMINGDAYVSSGEEVKRCRK